MILIAVSGGPDSMYLLHKYRRRKIVVAHVNYQMRFDAHKDEQIVHDYCSKNKIPLETLQAQPQSVKGNFQAWARDLRYQFFQQLAEKYPIKKVLTAHHKDDFLETALMQQRSDRHPTYFGMKKKQQLLGLKVHRPLLHKLWKREIERFCHVHHIPYAIDSSNDKPIYARNKIRQELAKLPFSEKRQYYAWFQMSNKILVKKHRKVSLLFKKWIKTNFDTRFFKEQRFKHELIFEFIHRYYQNIKLSHNKIEALVNFIVSNENNKFFKLNNTTNLYKNHFKLIMPINVNYPQSIPK